MTTAERFWAKVGRRGPDECWPWLGHVKANGYGQFRFAGQPSYAHRYAYELANGPIPPGHEVDHVRERGCRRRDCCNPRHLEAVTRRDNIMRGDGPAKLAQFHGAKTHCVHGHPFTPENTYRRRSGGRQCRTCKRARERGEDPANV